MKFDLTNLTDLIADPLSRLRLMKDYTQEAIERIIGDENEPVKKAVVLEVLAPSPNANNNTKNSNEQYYAIRARIENMHESLPDVVEFIDQKRTNEEINKLIDIAKPIFSLNPISSTDISATTPKPVVGDIVEIVEIEKGVYRFHNKIGTVQKLIGFTKNEDPNSLLEPAVVDPTSAKASFENGIEYDPNVFRPASGQIDDQTPVLAAANRGDFYENRGLPCSGYVAIWVMNQLGLIPDQEKWSDWKAWSRKDLTLWNLINIRYDKNGNKGKAGDTFNITAIQERLGGTIQHYSNSQTLPKPGPGPTLTVGRWHISQRWCPPGKSGSLPSGHIYLVYWDGSDKVRFVHSSHVNRYRDEIKPKNSWWGGGCSETVLTLPIGSKEGKAT
jgi:hypothetical protein